MMIAPRRAITGICSRIQGATRESRYSRTSASAGARQGTPVHII